MKMIRLGQVLSLAGLVCGLVLAWDLISDLGSKDQKTQIEYDVEYLGSFSGYCMMSESALPDGWNADYDMLTFYSEDGKGPLHILLYHGQERIDLGPAMAIARAEGYMSQPCLTMDQMALAEEILAQ